MSVFTSLVTKVLEVPGDPGQTITIRKLAPKHLETARTANQVKSMDALRAMGGPAFIREIQAMQIESTVVAEAVAADPRLLFDKVPLMTAGVIAWSYADRERTTEAFEDLDEATSDWLARELLMLAKPSLFETPADTEVAQKND